MLIKLYVLADRGRFTDDHPRPVIDEEIRTDGRAGMDVDPRPAVLDLRHHAGHHRDL